MNTPSSYDNLVFARSRLAKMGRWVKKHPWQFSLAYLFVFLLVLFIVTLRFALQALFYPPARPLTAREIAALDLRQEDEFLSAFVTLPTGPGNAARDLMEATHQFPFQERDGTAMPYEGFDNMHFPAWDGEDNQEKWRLLELSVIPEIETFRQAAERGGYRMWGEIIQFDPGQYWYNRPIPDYNEFNRMNFLSIVRAREAVRDDKFDEALGWYQDVIIINNHMEKDVLISQYFGAKYKAKAARDLVNYYFLRDEISRSAAWWEMFDRETDRVKILWDTSSTRYQCKFSDSDIIFMIGNPSFSPGWRMNTYELLALRWQCGGIWRLLFGPSRKEKQYLLETNFDCPELKEVQKITAAHLERGFLHRCRTLIDYYKVCYLSDDED